MSLIAYVLSSTEKLDKNDLATKVNLLRTKIDEVKAEVHASLQNKYIDFFPQYMKLNSSLGKLRCATNEYEILHSQIEKEIKPNVNNSVSEFHDVLAELEKIKILKSVVTELASLHNTLERGKIFMLRKNSVAAAQQLLKFEATYTNIKVEDKTDAKIFYALRTEFYFTKEKLIHQIEQMWRKNATITRRDAGQIDTIPEITLRLNKLQDYEIIEALMTLKLLENIEPLMKEFGKRFLKEICEVVVQHHTMVEICENDEYINLVVTITSEHCPEPSEVFKHLREIFNLLNTMYFGVRLVDEVDGIDMGKGMNELGGVIGKDFCSMLIDKCLKPAMPTQTKDLEGFKKELENAQNFSNILEDYGFFKNCENILKQFISDADKIPLNRLAQELVRQARDLIKEPLHLTAFVGVKNTSSNAAVTGEDADEDYMNSQPILPYFQVSVSIKALVDLFIEVLEESRNSDSEHSARFFYIAHNICDIYLYVAPLHHKREIDNIPLQTAIFHNNCYFLNHNLTVFGAKYPTVTENPMSLVEFAQEIKKLGSGVFFKQLRHQHEQLSELLLEAFENIGTEESFFTKADKSIRQVLFHLRLLKKAWSDILSMELYCKSIGFLLNSCLGEIMQPVLSLEDITAKTASNIDILFRLLLDESPELFQTTLADESDCIHNYVSHWFKFRELRYLMNFRLKEIVDRWANGKGILASHFTIDEVKHMIRALFQNTEMRAAALTGLR